MYCPRCLTEYRDGLHECASCHVPLAAGAAPKPSVERTIELVAVLETGDALAVRLAKAALEDAGIRYIVTGDESLYIAGARGASGAGETPPAGRHCVIRVASESTAEARRLLAPLQRSETGPGAGSGPEAERAE